MDEAARIRRDELSRVLSRMVRDADLNLRDLDNLRRAAKEAWATGQAPEEFIAENPAAEPIVNLLIQQGPRRDWLPIFVMIVIAIINVMQTARDHVEEEHQKKASTPTLVLTDQQVSDIAHEIEVKLLADGEHS